MGLLQRLRDVGNSDAVMSRQAAEERTNDLLELWRKERDRLDVIDRYLSGDHDLPYMPKEAKQEYKLLARRAVTNLCPLIVNETVQALRVDGYRRKDQPDNANAWRWWQANGLDARQMPLHHASLSYGLSYEVVLPGEDSVTREPAPLIRGLSPREMYAAYGDPAWDDWPLFAIRVEPQGQGVNAVTLYDETAVYRLTAGSMGGDATLLDWQIHGLGVCPVVKFADMPDLEGRVTGQVAPYVTMQDRINQDVFDRLLTQTYSSFKVRTATGIAVEKDKDGNPVKPIEVERNRLLTTSNKDARFDSLDESPIGPFLESEEQDVRRLATMSQTPPTSLLGQITNMTAESLVVARMGADGKTDDRKQVYGEAHEQKLRLAALAAGDTEGSRDVEAEVRWRDMGARALAQLADAFTKLASPEGLGLPRQLLWEKLPFLTQTDVERAKEMAAEADGLRQLLDRVGADLDADG